MWQRSQLAVYSGPLYKRVILLIEHYIDEGLLIAGERLPAERQLALQLAINRSTIVHALDELSERGVLVRQLGRGTFVNQNKWGLQTSPTINWHLPVTLNRSPSLYQQKVAQLRQRATEQQLPLHDLANGDLPGDLIPVLSLPKMSRQELIYQEQNSDALLLGLPSLRQDIADYMAQQFAMQVDVNQIMITSGTQQSLFLISQGLLKPGDAIGIEAPSYFYLLPLFQAAGLRIYGISCDEEGIDLHELAKVVERHRIKWIFLNPIFQNPTGRLTSLLRRQEINHFCYQNCIAVVEDDAYSALSFLPSLDVTPIKKQDAYNQVIYLGSLSKYIGRTIRIGWMIGPETILKKLAEIRQQIDSGLSILPQLLAQDYLQNHYNSHLPYLQKQLHQRAQKLQNWLSENYAGQLQFTPPQGGFHLYAKLNDEAGLSEQALLSRLLARHILVAQGQDFGDNSAHFRFSYGHLTENLL